jgi:hypothetical protein
MEHLMQHPLDLKLWAMFAAYAFSQIAFAQTTLDKYYTFVCDPRPPPREQPIPQCKSPQVDTIRNWVGRSAQTSEIRRIADFAEITYLGSETLFTYVSSELALYSGSGGRRYSCDQVNWPNPFAIGSATLRDTYVVESASSENCIDTIGPIQITNTWNFTDTFTFGAPVRRKAFDGSEYEASPMVQKRNGQPWLTLYWGYRLGLVETQHDWNPAVLTPLPAFAKWPTFAPKDAEVKLVTLPPPRVEGIVTEYVNTENFPTSPGGVYFYAGSDEERVFIDSGTPGKWVRTGKGFKSGGYVSVCRFYGSLSPGPNAHFFTASENECSVVKSLQTIPTPLDRQQFNFVGTSFRASVPSRGADGLSALTCPQATIPVYRAYNAAYGLTGKKNYDSNHRLSTSRADIDTMVAMGWTDEGLVMCVPQ